MKWKKVIIYVENDKHLDKFIRNLTFQAQVSFYAVIRHNR